MYRRCEAAKKANQHGINRFLIIGDLHLPQIETQINFDLRVAK